MILNFQLLPACNSNSILKSGNNLLQINNLLNKILKSYFFTNSFHIFCQSGQYLDFFFKKLAEVFLKNFFLYSALFFGEKYMIENLTKTIFKSLTAKVNYIANLKKLTYSLYFIQFLNFFFYSVALI